MSEYLELKVKPGTEVGDVVIELYRDDKFIEKEEIFWEYAGEVLEGMCFRYCLCEIKFTKIQTGKYTEKASDLFAPYLREHEIRVCNNRALKKRQKWKI